MTGSGGQQAQADTVGERLSVTPTFRGRRRAGARQQTSPAGGSACAKDYGRDIVTDPRMMSGSNC